MAHALTCTESHPLQSRVQPPQPLLLGARDCMFVHQESPVPDPWVWPWQGYMPGQLYCLTRTLCHWPVSVTVAGVHAGAAVLSEKNPLSQTRECDRVRGTCRGSCAAW